MKIIQTIFSLKQALATQRNAKKTVGLVPTMGALHAGHIELVTRCVAENDICVVSIFVNPTQFNDKNDLLKYPRTLDTDCQMLEKAGCSIVFIPEIKEMYPEPDTRIFNFGLLEQVMEGSFRPGHFNGVAQIVSKLFDIIEPGKAYFGEKDFQQLAIIREMVKQLNLNTEIVACPIVREQNGLAMSSRNALLNPSEYKSATKISEILFKSRSFAGKISIPDLKKQVVEAINAVPLLRIEYFEIVDGKTLQPVPDWNSSDDIVGCIAVFCGNVRLIDNIKYKG
ncbi:MAG: pantoate--beta-alanine ligase [Candidatus Azobacteroides sp.]|nr:pantoate--beta-alanine ligase [Candidatus Azobacteroides sp.]